jgi:hypothetical protein
METTRTRKRFRHWRWLAILPAAAACWFVVRSFEYGPLNVFFRNHHFTDDRPLTDDLAVEYTGKTLQAEGFDPAALKLKPYDWNHWNHDRFHNETFFNRNTIHSNEGDVLWGDPHHAAEWEYIVTIEKNGSDICCRVYRPM